MIQLTSKPLPAALAAITLSLASAPGQAQQTEHAEVAPLEEVVVTARRREESLQDVPIAIDTLDSARIEQFNVQSTADVARYTPALTFDVSALPQDTRPSIRGVNAARGRPNVGILIDFVDVSSEAMTAKASARRGA